MRDRFWSNQHSFSVFGGHGPPEQKPLSEAAADGGEKFLLRLSFDAFSDDVQSQVVSQANDGVHDRKRAAALVQPCNEGAVDLDGIHRKVAQVRQRCKSGPEVIKSDTDICFPERMAIRGHDISLGG